MRLVPIQDPVLREQFDRIAADGMDIFLLNDSNYRGAVLHATRLINQMRENHALGVLETLMLGHAYIAAGLLLSLVKGRDRISMTLDCDGPAKGFSVESNAHGEVRGYLRTDSIPVDSPPQSFDLSPYIGEGTLQVTRHLEKAKQPFSGTVDIAYGNLAKDLAHYFVVSEQLPTAVSLSIQFDREGRVSGAGGLFIQGLPGADATAGPALEEQVRSLPSLGGMFASGETPAHIINRNFEQFNPDVIGARTVEFSCPCSKNRYGDYLASLPDEELEDMAQNGPFPLIVTCHNCNSNYAYSKEEILQIRAGRQSE